MAKGKILVVEDELIVATDLQEQLFLLEYHVELAHDYDEALRKTKEFKPNLILCDINLNNEKNGVDFIKVVKYKNPDIEVIFLTAYSSNEFVRDAEKTGPINYIVKPYSEKQIEIAVRLAFNYIKTKVPIGREVAVLTHSELKILQLISLQKTSREIADTLYISDKTVRNHRYNISKKLNLPPENNSLLRWAMQNLKHTG